MYAPYDNFCKSLNVTTVHGFLLRKDTVAVIFVVLVKLEPTACILTNRAQRIYVNESKISSFLTQFSLLDIESKREIGRAHV